MFIRRLQQNTKIAVKHFRAPVIEETSIFNLPYLQQREGPLYSNILLLKFTSHLQLTQKYEISALVDEYVIVSIHSEGRREFKEYPSLYFLLSGKTLASTGHKLTRAFGENIPLPRHVIISKCKNMDCIFCIQPVIRSLSKLIGSKLDQVLSADFFHEVPTSGICIILLTNKQTDKQL